MSKVLYSQKTQVDVTDNLRGEALIFDGKGYGLTYRLMDSAGDSHDVQGLDLLAIQSSCPVAHRVDLIADIRKFVADKLGFK